MNSLTPILVAVLLTFAATSKMAETFTVELSAALVGTWLLCAAEIALAALLLSTWRRHARIVGLLIFSTFTVYSGILVVRKVEDCACFGSTQMPPLVVLGIDLIAIALLLAWQTDPDKPASHVPKNLAHLWIVPPLVCIGLSIVTYSQTYRAADADELIEIPPGKTIALFPTRWIDGEFPLKHHIKGHLPDSIWNGRIRIVLYRETCSECKLRIGELLANDTRDKLMFLSLDGTQHRNLYFSADSNVFAAKLDERWRWAIEVPTEILVDDGRVAQVW